MKNIIFSKTPLLILLFSLIILSSQVIANQSSLAVMAAAETQPRNFLRLADNKEHKALQVAIVRYSATNSDLYVDLISAVHVADRQYYAQLNELFKRYDVVLYELVAPEGTKIPKGGKQSAGFVSMIQMGMKNILGLSFQLEEIDYTARNFVHADMTPTEFSNSMKKRGESMFGTMIKLWRAGMVQQLSGKSEANNIELISAFFADDKEHALKSIFAKEFENMGGVLGALEGTEGSTLVTERNKKALAVLKNEISSGKKSLAIFYGAAHMDDIGKRLQAEFDLQAVSEYWIDAWDLN